MFTSLKEQVKAKAASAQNQAEALKADSQTAANRAADSVKDSVKASVPVALKKQEVDPLVARLTANHAVYSSSFLSDFWLLALKNQHILFSLPFAHPKHPFSRMERIVVLLISCIYGFGLTCLFNLIEDENARYYWSLILGSLLQGLYDVMLRGFAECRCVQGRQRALVSVAEGCGKVGLFFQLVHALSVLGLGYWLLNREGGDTDLVSEVGTAFVLSKATSWFVTSFLFSLAFFARARRAQMKPSAEADLEAWGLRSKQLWDTFIGADVAASDLPSCAPGYANSLLCLSWGVPAPAPASVELASEDSVTRSAV